MHDSWKTWLWRTLVTTAIIVVIGACFYAEENMRGVRTWQECERELAARGESIKWDDYIPAPVPDAQNFYKASAMTEWFVKAVKPIASPPPQLLPTSNPETTINVITEISASNYIAWSAAFEPGLDLIRNAVQRPFARMDADYKRPIQRPVPNFVNYRLVSQTLAHRARCYLLLHQPDKALTDLTLLHELSQTLVKDGKPNLLVSSMIHVAISGIYVDAVTCGIQSQSWREPELKVLQKQLTEINLLPEVAYTFHAERASICQMLDVMTPQELMQRINGTTRQVSDIGWWFMPSGWILQNKAVVATIEEKTIDSFDFTNNTISPYKVKAASTSMNQVFSRITPWNFLASICVPNFNKAAIAMARNQASADQTQIACALERWRIANGKYPATLAALVPQFMAQIPHDVIGGRSMNYSCNDGEGFRLYSIGWDETDDDGITIFDSSGAEDREHGDWVWQVPQK